MTTILKITEEDFQDALTIANEYLKSGKIIIYPTDTVYGIGGDATSEKIVKKIAEIKGIAHEKPMSVIVPDLGTIDYYCDTGLWEDMILGRYLPGPYTFVLKKRREIPTTTTEKLGIRMPDSTFCQALSQKFGKPIITTSANITKQNAPTKFEDIKKEVLDQVELAIDGGTTKYHSPSLVIDLVEREIIRPGMESISLIEFPER